jgi:hypothetical protein
MADTPHPEPAGERITAGALFSAHAAFVAKFLKHLGVPRREVDDLVQDVFMTVHTAQATSVTPVTPVAAGRVRGDAQSSSSSLQQSEVARLLRAHALLRSDPKAALALLRQLEHDSPRGVLREERDGLMVLALWSAGEQTRARELARRFLANYPSSALRERMRALLDDPAKQESP